MNSLLAFAIARRWNAAMKWIGLTLLLFCGCASNVVLPPPQVSTADFAVTPLPHDVYLIAYKGPAQPATDRLLDLALLKASQVTQEKQFKYFVIVDQDSSKPGNMKFRRTLPGPGEWNNELLVQAFKARPRRVFCFRAEATEQAIYEKFRTVEEPATL
jgi:hypothetical protein